MRISLSNNLRTKENLTRAVDAFGIVRNLSKSELETLEILSNQEDRDLILDSLEESERGDVLPIESIL